MDFFNEIMKFGDIFESQETIDELKDISDEIKKYDVYDVLARISGLNLMPHNQNKSVSFIFPINFLNFPALILYVELYVFSSSQIIRFLMELIIHPLIIFKCL